tara:strand:- start:99 stop:1331 length:1233 start_codon:yes stop_codon:yes gene_type:complete
MAEFSWAYIDTDAVVTVAGPTGSVQYRVADSAGHTVMSGTENFIYHTASSELALGGSLSASANISASAFYGDGSNLSGVGSSTPGGATTQIQFNNAGAFGATARATITAAASSAALIVTGSITVTGSANDATTTIDGTHVSSSLNVSGSSFYGDGSNLTGVSASPAGATTQIQFNNAGSVGATANAIIVAGPSSAALVVTGSTTTVGSVQTMSGSTQVFGVDSSVAGLGAARGRMVQHIRSSMSIAAGGNARTGRYISIGGNASSTSATPTQINCMVSPFSGRLISATYWFGASAGTQDPSLGQPVFEMRVGDVNAFNGNNFANSFSVVGQVTASSWPGYRHVGGFNVQNKVGTLHGDNATGSFSFGTGSSVALYFQSGDATGNNTCGDAAWTTVWEFDQLDPYISGSGN